MGYTHYFPQTRAANEVEWDRISHTFRTLLRIAPQPIQYEADERKPVMITKDQIHFNGVEDDGHETMLVMPVSTGFNFCKTAVKPYDRAVVCLLIMMEHFAPGVWDITSDGNKSDWNTHLHWLNSQPLNVTFKLPEGI